MTRIRTNLTGRKLGWLEISEVLKTFMLGILIHQLEAEDERPAHITLCVRCIENNKRLVSVNGAIRCTSSNAFLLASPPRFASPNGIQYITWLSRLRENRRNHRAVELSKLKLRPFAHGTM